MQITQAASRARHYGMDWLRIGAFLLLILYHIGMFFVHWDWHVKTASPMTWVAIPMLAPNSWRIPLLFVVSGYASRAVLAKSAGPGRFAWDRTLRLLVPTIAAAALVIPPQPWVELVFKHGYPHGLGHFWLGDYFRFGALDGLIMPTWQHLWFVVYLWVYTLFAALILTVLPARWRGGLAGFADRLLAGPLVLLVPIGLLLANIALGWPGHQETHGLFDDGPAHRVYFAFFLFGLLLPAAPHAWAGIRRWWKAAAMLAIAAYGVVAWIEFVWPGKMVPPLETRILFQAARAIQGWSAIVALLGIADRFWNRDHRWRATLTEAVFPVYIIHQTIIVLLGWWLLRFALPPLAEFAILVAATVAGCWLFYRLGREVPGLRVLIGLRGWRPPPRPMVGTTG